MAFMAAMNAMDTGLPAGMKYGANGAICYSEEGIGDLRVALYTSLVRGITHDAIQDFLDKLDVSNISEADRVRDTWLIAMQGRDVRGGKGERDAFYELFSEFACRRPFSETMKLLELVPEYGCWRDLFFLMHENPLLIAPAEALIHKQFFKDLAAARSQETSAQISLLAKWLPRERADERMVKNISESLYPSIRSEAGRLALYRKHCSEINRALKTVEVAQCGGAWRTIEPAHVPGRALKLYRKAFLNEKLNGRPGVRYDKEDRIVCAERFREHLGRVACGEATVNGADTVFPHEIVQKIAHTRSVEEEQLLEGQWAAIREKVAASGKLSGKCVPMCDFSGSMGGTISSKGRNTSAGINASCTPLQVSMALGILLSEVNHPAFKDGMLTFDSNPHWVSFKPGMSLAQKVRYAGRHGQGLSTNFEAALKLVLQRMIDAKVPVGEEPDALVVFTDMGFDAACRGGTCDYNTILERFQKQFAMAGGWKVPTIVIWNLRAEYKDYHARADRNGVIMLSGWSPSSMKILMNGIKVQTPYDAMREILDDKRYDAVRAALAGAEVPPTTAA